MGRMIAVVDMVSGVVSVRARDTRTFDVPVDFDRDFGEAACDARLHALYRSTRGKEVSCTVFPRPLSWRVEGEECLVADEGAAQGSFRLCAIEPG